MSGNTTGYISIEEIARPTISAMIGEVDEDIKLLKQAAVAYNKKNRLKFLIYTLQS